MDNEVLSNRIKRYQEYPVSHPLTCGNDSNHQLLRGEIQDGKVVLICADCGYRQEKIPSLFFSERFDEMYDEQKRFLQSLK